MFNATFNMFYIVSYPCLIYIISYLLIYINVIFDILCVIYFTLSIKQLFLMYIYIYIVYIIYVLYSLQINET